MKYSKLIPLSRHDVAGERGMTVVELLVTVVIVAIVAAIAIPAYSRFVQKSRETAVMSYIYKIVKAEESHRLYDPSNRYTENFTDLAATGIVLHDGGDSEKTVEHGYEFKLDAKFVGGKPVWSVKAEPKDESADKRWFYADQTGIIRCKTGSHANGSSPPCTN